MNSNKNLWKALILGAFFVSCSGPEKSNRPLTPIIPSPSQAMALEGKFVFNVDTRIDFNASAEPEALYLQALLEEKTGMRFQTEKVKKGKPKSNSILLNIIKGDTLSEAYSVQITEDHIWITAEGRRGIFYGIQTLRQLLPPSFETGDLKGQEMAVEALLIEDHPRFAHRGLLLDCCRHFMDKSYVKRMIDLLAYHKMNVLHWHLTEDQGWRIETDAYPKLTEVGAWRTEADGSFYGGFYSKEDIREVVAYAASRHITVIPEIELPGHSLAALAAYPELSCTGDPVQVTPEWGVFKDIYCAGNDSVFVFLETVLDEVLALFPSEYIHIGGDEAPKFRWENCPKCQNRIKSEGLKDEHELQSYFIGRIGKYLASKGRKIIGWDEILEGGLPAGAAVQSWRGMDGGLTAANQDHYVVMSPTSHCYFDYDLASIDLEMVYSFDPIPSSLPTERHKFILGGECNMWTERAPQETVDSKVFPRLLAMAEILWHYPSERDFAAFSERVDFHYQRLDGLHVKYGAEGRAAQISPRVAGEYPALKISVSNPKVNIKIRKSADAQWESVSGDEPIVFADMKQNQTTTAEISAERNGKPYGEPISIRLLKHHGLGGKVSLASEPKAQYLAGGSQALADGALGAEDNFNDGLWQGTYGSDVIAMVELDATKKITGFGCRFFQYQNSWIFLPRAVEFRYSTDGENWILAGTSKRNRLPVESGKFTEEFRVRLNVPVAAKFVKMTAFGIGKCPEWHDAAGQPSWLFCDELIVY